MKSKTKSKVRVKKVKAKTKSATQQKVDTPAEAAIYYGFTPVTGISVKHEDNTRARALKSTSNKAPSESGPVISTAERFAVIREYQARNLQNSIQPAMLYIKGPIANEDKSVRNSSKAIAFNLEIIGSVKSISEAIAVETILAILREEGYKNLFVEINSVGEKDASAKYIRELGNYYRKHINELGHECRQMMKQDVLELHECKDGKCQDIHERAPKSIAFLSEPSRRHFQEILEYLEALNVPYRVNCSLVGNKFFSAGPVFEIRDSEHERKDGKPPLAIGSRYDGVTRRLGLRKDMPAVTASAYFRPMKKDNGKHRVKDPKVFFIQLGFDAKLKSLKVIEILRQAKIPTLQSLGRDKLGAQIAQAEKMKTPYVLIMGQKEAMEDAVIVRKISTRSQDTVKISELTNYLKKIQK